jgi:Ca-activated chloride channel family protein
MIKFAHSEYLYALTMLPILILLFFWAMRQYRRSLQQFGTLSLLQRLMPGAARYKRTMKFTLFIIAFSLLVLGLANPQFGSKLEEVKRQGVDIFICLDVSNSMKAEDIKPNRLEKAKREILQLLDKFENDRIGIIVFAGKAYLQLPLTTDYSAARLFLSTIDVDIVPVQGTAIGSAIRLAMQSFVEREKKHKVIIVITDGENHEDDAIAAANDAANDGIIVHTIGMGSPLGAPIPVYQNGIQMGFKKDGEGNIVITKLDNAALQQIAQAGNGKYIGAANNQNELDEIFKEVQAMEKKEIGAKVFTEYEDRFQYLLFMAFVFFTLESFISERKNPLFERFRSFISRPSKYERMFSEQGKEQ